MANRRFSMQPAEDDEDGPDTITLDGKRTKSGEAWEETFTLLPDIPPGAHLDLIAGAVLNEDGQVGWQPLPIARFIRAVIVPDDEPRWDVLIRDKDRRLEPEQLGMLMFWITGEKTARPTGRQPGSSAGSPNGRTGSEDEPSPPVTEPTGSTEPL